METSWDEKETEDPDYESVSKERRREQGNLSTRQQDAKEQAIQRIEQIIRQQFGFEIHLKEREIDVIDERIRQAKVMLDRLRACVLAKYYGTSEIKGNRTSTKLDRGELCAKRSARHRMKQAGFPRTETVTATSGGTPCKLEPRDNCETTNPARIEALVNGSLVNRELETKKPFEAGGGEAFVHSDSNTLLSTEKQEKVTLHSRDSVKLTDNSGEQLKIASSLSTLVQQNHQIQSGTGITHNRLSTHFNEESALNAIGNPLNAASMPVTCAGSRFYLKKRIIVGNTSKYISIDSREDNDKSTHKWMVYVRGPPEDPHIDRFIMKVWFFLHPSYRPNDIVEVNKPPFHLTRRGWGEFPVRVQLHFIDPRNKRVDVIHELKLDRTYTGLQTLGSETVVDLELDRRTFEDNCIPYTLSNSSIEESFATNLIAVSTSSSQRNYNNNIERSLANTLSNKEQNETLATAGHKYPASLNNRVQYPQLTKKIKLETPMSVSSSAFSSVTSTPVNSLPASRCSSPEPVSDSRNVANKLSDETHELLKSAAKEHPLIHPERNVMKYPYCASSFEQFLGWNIGKRRACEWQRAAAIKRDISTRLPSCKLSTKDVLVWCRRFGYSPCDKVTVGENVSFCKLCGGHIPDVNSDETESHKCEEQPFTSLSTSSRFFADVEEKERYLPDVPQTDNESEDLEIDVVGVLPEKRTIKPQESKSLVYPASPTPEQEWVREACTDIGVKLKTVNIDGVNLHVVESLLLAATKRFAEDILRQSWACATDQTTPYGSRLVTPSHVHKAVRSLPYCDFLSNANLGEELSVVEK